MNPKPTKLSRASLCEFTRMLRGSNSRHMKLPGLTKRERNELLKTDLKAKKASIFLIS